MNIAVQLGPPADTVPGVDYRWDTDTDILTARLDIPAATAGSPGSVDLEGADGSWVILELSRGRLQGLEVAVWPDVHRRATLQPPAVVEDGCVSIPLVPAPAGPAALEVDTSIIAESDEDERVIYFRVGAKRPARSVRVARDLLVDLDPQQRIAGLWLLNVPPFPPT